MMGMILVYVHDVWCCVEYDVLDRCWVCVCVFVEVCCCALLSLVCGCSGFFVWYMHFQPHGGSLKVTEYNFLLCVTSKWVSNSYVMIKF